MHGKRVRKGLISTVLAVLLALSTVLTAFADYPGIDLDKEGTITVRMESGSDENKTAVGGGQMAIYKVAEVYMDPDTGDYSYVVIEPYTGSSYDFEGEIDGKTGDDTGIDWPQLAQDFADYIHDEGIEGEEKGIDDDGIVTFDGLYPGLYLLVQTVPADGYYAANPFLVSMPTYTEDEDGNPDYSYEVDASPKTEVYPGPTKDVNVDVEEEEEKQYDDNGVIVGVGKTLTYKVTYTNSHAVKAKVVITDVLDPNVEYVDGSATAPTSGYASYDFQNEGGTLVWTIEDVPARESGEVTFQVLVLESAEVPSRVDNTATVKIDNDNEVETEPIWNPVPRKDVDVDTTDDKDYGDDGVLVAVGQTLTYKVEFQNGLEEAADIVITDELDPNVEYVDDSATGPDGYEYTVEYADRTLTWTIYDVASLYKGEVTFQVTVLDTAPEVGYVDNTALVKVGDDSAYTNTVHNPVPHKIVDTNGDGEDDNGVTVHVGDELVYEIFYENGHDTEASVTITDVLDKGLDFVSAENDGTYNEEDRIITWEFTVPANTKGSVKFTAKVNTTGRIQREVYNDADVQFKDDPSVKTNPVENPVPGGGSSRSGGGGGGSGSGGGSSSGGPGDGGSSGEGDTWNLLPLPSTGQGWAMLIAVCAMIVAGIGLIVAHVVRRKD